ncbi:MAG: DUF4339 domain-containing protein, partial [Limisphaerales bacterium]
MADWYYRFNGSEQGPISEEDLKHIFDSGALPLSTPVWKEGSSGWCRADQTSEFFQRINLSRKEEPQRGKALIVIITITMFIVVFYSSKGSPKNTAATSL